MGGLITDIEITSFIGLITDIEIASFIDSVGFSISKVPLYDHFFFQVSSRSMC